MSWDASLSCGYDHEIASWNYTHNTNGMIEAVLEGDIESTEPPWWTSLAPRPDIGRYSWWDLLNGSSGADGAALLDRIIKGLDNDPSRFRSMNPPNGWGDYDGLLGVLHEMRDAVPEHPATWAVHG